MKKIFLVLFAVLILSACSKSDELSNKKIEAAKNDFSDCFYFYGEFSDLDYCFCESANDKMRQAVIDIFIAYDGMGEEDVVYSGSSKKENLAVFSMGDYAFYLMERENDWCINGAAEIASN